MTLQALSESNRRLWLEAMDGKEPVRNSACLVLKYSFCVGCCMAGMLLSFFLFEKRTIPKWTVGSLAPSSGG